MSKNILILISFFSFITSCKESKEEKTKDKKLSLSEINHYDSIMVGNFKRFYEVTFLKSSDNDSVKKVFFKLKNDLHIFEGYYIDIKNYKNSQYNSPNRSTMIYSFNDFSKTIVKLLPNLKDRIMKFKREIRNEIEEEVLADKLEHEILNITQNLLVDRLYDLTNALSISNSK